MPSYGSYNTIEELSVHGFVSAFRAERVSGEGPVGAVVKVLNTKGDGIIEPTNPEEMVVEFLDAARVQQRIARSSSQWAHVYDTGLTRGGAFYAIEYFDRSVQRLLDMRAHFTAGHLFCLVEQVAQALIDLRQLSDRAHGNLKPSNLLVRGQFPDGPESVVLSDPLSSAQLTPRHASEDLESLGRLIYQCVTRTPVAGRVLYPVSDSPEWGELGRRGSRLRDLCNLLLDPEKRPEAKLAELGRHLSGRERSRKVVKTAAAIGLLALLGTGGWGYVHKYGVPFASLFSKHDRMDTGGRTDTDPPTTRVIIPTTSTLITTRTTTDDVPSNHGDVVRNLMAAQNPDAAFSLKVDAEIYESQFGNGQCVSLTVSPTEDCYVMVVNQDSKGVVTLLIPNGEKPGCPKLLKGEHVALKDFGSELPVMKPYGQTIFKVIACARPIEFIGATPNSQTNYFEGIVGLSLDNPQLSEPTLAILLKPGDWATAQVEIVTQAPKAAATNPSGVTGSP